VASYYSTFLADGNHTIYHAAKREWVQQNPAAAKAFREAVQEGAAFMQQPKNGDKVRAAIGKYIKLPPDVLAKMQISTPGPTVNQNQVNYWLAMMKDQDMLKTPIDAARLLVK
jgi:NitT/TauT family transport system substrate-binding protein